MKRKQLKIGFMRVSFAFALSAASVLLIPFTGGNEEGLSTLGYAAGIMFWAGLLMGILGYLLLCRKARLPKEVGREVPGIFRFFSNPAAGMVDGIMLIGILGTGYCVWDGGADWIWEEILLICAIAGIYAHGLFNGKIYRYIQRDRNNLKGSCINE